MSRTLLPIAVASALLAGAFSAALAAPTTSAGQPVVAAPAIKHTDSPQARAFREGVQALLLHKDKPGQARAHFEQALKLDPKYVPAMLGLASVAQAEKQRQQAEQWLVKAEQLEPRSSDVHLGWGRFHASQGQLAKAEKSLVAARDLAPRTIPPLLELGDLYLRSPQHQADALESFRAAVALNPENGHAQFGLGVAAAANGRRDDAVAALQAAAKIAPRDPEPVRMLGRVYLEAAQYDKALSAFDASLKRFPTYVPSMMDRTDALARQGQWNPALEQLKVAAKTAPAAAPAIALKQGDVLQAAGRAAEAEASYLKAIQLAPKDPLAYNNLAWLTVDRRGDAAKAVGWAKKAVELSPGSSPFLDTLGWAQRAAGDLPGAAATLAKAIQAEPKVAGYHYHLGVVQAELKQRDAARASLQKALELDPRLPQADDVRRLLKDS